MRQGPGDGSGWRSITSRGARFAVLPKLAQGAKAIVATGLMPAGARDVAEKLGIGYALASFHTLGLPAEKTNELYLEALNSNRSAIGLPPVDDVRSHVRTEQSWLAADPTLESLSVGLSVTLAPETLARAQALAPTIDTDGTTRAAELLVS